MALYSINIGSQEFKVAIATTDEQKYKGLSGYERLGKYKGLLFIFSDPQPVRMVMRDMKFPLDFIFLDEDWKVIKLDSLDNKLTEETICTQPVSMVLEINKDKITESGIKESDICEPEDLLRTQLQGIKKFKEGGKFEMIGDIIYKIKEDDVKIDPTKMQILDKDGNVTTNIDSGTRIFSRPHTKKIIDLVKEKDLLELGKTVVEIYDIQDKQKQEFVKK